jgi:hypothetical protein
MEKLSPVSYKVLLMTRLQPTTAHILLRSHAIRHRTFT